MAGKIAPKKLATGADFCGVDKYYYVVRADLTCCMRSTNFTTGEDLEVFRLHPCCRGGDHYLAHKNEKFYIIKGDCYRCVTNMNTDEDSVVYSLHPNCQGGDHYLSASDYFYVIYQSRGVYRQTKNMATDEDGEEFTLHPNCKNGLYYFGTSGFYCFVKPTEQGEVQYVRCKNFNTNENAETFSIRSSVINFLPGGLGITMGPAYGEWVCIKTISNDVETPVLLNTMIVRKVGYEKEKMSSIEHNWTVSPTVTEETGGLTALIAKSQFSLTAEYGGCNVNTEKENWSEVVNMEVTISINLQAHQGVYIWTYQLGLGKDTLLHCRDMRILDTSHPPAYVPLPPAVNKASSDLADGALAQLSIQ